jgi:aminodeoxyfutalosine synthase
VFPLSKKVMKSLLGLPVVNGQEPLVRYQRRFKRLCLNHAVLTAFSCNAKAGHACLRQRFLKVSSLRMNYFLIPKELRPIAGKVEARERISDADALQLYRSNDLNALGIMSGAVRQQKNGNYATYILNRYINYSNICVLSCQFCAFAAKKRDAHAFERAIEDILKAVGDALKMGITEVHMVGGLHPTLKKDWYLKLLRELRKLDSNLHIKAFTAIEVRHLAQRIFRMSIEETLETLRAAGLGSMTGGGAEIFDAAVRDEICRGKESAAEWLDVHRSWHNIGGRSTCTMLYGHIETLEQRVDHLRQLRELQDETRGFTGFVPFAFEPQTTVLAHVKPASAFEQLRNLAVSRIYLDNIEHLTAYWVSMGLPLAQVSLSYGVDDLHGTIMEEKIFHMAGATTPQELTVATLEQAIREAGRDPIQRDSYYRHIGSARIASTNGARPAEVELACA